MKQKIIFGAISIVLLFAMIIPLMNNFERRSDDENAEKTVLLTMSGFEPVNLQLEAGVETAVLLVNMETEALVGHDMLHQFASDELGFNYLLHSGDRQVVLLRVEEPGEYEIYCDTCCGGRENPFMRGKIIVT